MRFSLNMSQEEFIQYTAEIGKYISKIKNKFGINTVRQNYSGTGSKQGIRQLFLRMHSGYGVDIWLERDYYRIGGVIQTPCMRMRFPYINKTSLEIAEEAVGLIQKLEQGKNKNAGVKDMKDVNVVKELVAINNLLVGLSNQDGDNSNMVKPSLKRLSSGKVPEAFKKQWEKNKKGEIDDKLKIARKLFLVAKDLLAIPMAFEQPSGASKRWADKVLRQALRSEHGKEVMHRYMIYTSNTSNKFHYFAVYKNGNEYVGGNAYGRIGYNPRAIEVARGDKNIIRLVENKMRAKTNKGYIPTEV